MKKLNLMIVKSILFLVPHISAAKASEVSEVGQRKTIKGTISGGNPELEIPMCWDEETNNLTQDGRFDFVIHLQQIKTGNLVEILNKISRMIESQSIIARFGDENNELDTMTISITAVRDTTRPDWREIRNQLKPIVNSMVAQFKSTPGVTTLECSTGAGNSTH